MEKRTVSTTEASQKIGVHPNTVLGWIRSGKLLAHKNESNHWEIPVGEVSRMKRQMGEEEEMAPEVARAAARSLEVRWRRGLVERMRELLIAAQRYRMDMWEWQQEEDPIQQQEILKRVMRRSFPDLLDKAAIAKQWHDFEELGTEMFQNIQVRGERDEENP